MKAILTVFLVSSVLAACVSSGVEPNWDAQARDSHFPEDSTQSSPSGDYRVELRRVGSGSDEADAGTGVIRMESFRNGVRVGGGSSASSTETRSRSHSTSFGVGRIGHPISILAGRDSFVVVLEGAPGSSLSARVVQQSAPSLSLGHSRGTSLNTRVMAPLGRWVALGGIDESSDNASTTWQLGQNSSASGRQAKRHSKTAIELRVSPWKP
jgi:hypothetical protein